MNVIQSYLTTIMHGDFSLYEVRIFTKIVEHANQVLKGQRISSLLGRAITTDGITANISIPVREILSDGSKDYAKVFEAAKRLVDKKIELWDTKTGEWVSNVPDNKKGRTHRYSSIINNLSYKEGDGMIRFTVPVWLLGYILDLTNRHYSMYDLQMSLTLPSAYAVRMYWLVCSATAAIPYPLEMLRQMLGVGDKYPAPKDFVRRCIEPPRRILEERKMNGFTYKVIHKNPKSRTSPIVSILIIPVKRQAMTKRQLTAQAGISAWCDPQLRMYLSSQCEFTDNDLQKIKPELFEFQKLKDWRNALVRIVNNARKKRAGKGYIINGMRSEIAEKRTL